jgi:two-component system response regulator PrrA
VKLLDRRYFLRLVLNTSVAPPFARTQTCLSKAAQLLSLEAPSVIAIGGLVVNRAMKTVAINGRQVQLTTKEYQLAEILSLYHGSALSRELLLTYLYRGMTVPGHRMIDVFIAMLRHKFEKASTGGKTYIEWLPGPRYVLRAPR